MNSSEAHAQLMHYCHVLIETYPGTRFQEVRAWIDASGYKGLIMNTMKFVRVSVKAFYVAIAGDLTKDCVFERLTHYNYRDFFDFYHIKQWLAANVSAYFIVIGIGAQLFAPPKRALNLRRLTKVGNLNTLPQRRRCLFWAWSRSQHA